MNVEDSATDRLSTVSMNLTANAIRDGVPVICESKIQGHPMIPLLLMLTEQLLVP